MNEFQLIWMSAIGIIIPLIFSTATAIGGRSTSFLKIRNRIWKRIIAPIVFVSLVLVTALISGNFNWWYLTLFLTYWISCTFGYGGKKTIWKITRRTIWSLVRTAACLPIALILMTSWGWLLFGLQGVIGLLTAVLLGVVNPLKAPIEEFLINFFSVLIVAYMVI